MANGRDIAYRGQTVRLYSYFYSNGQLSDPYSPGLVYIHDGTLPALDGLGGLTPYHPSPGTYYVEWDILPNQEPKYYYDLWSGIQLSPFANTINRKFSVAVLYAPTEDIPIPEEVAVLSGLCRVYEFFVSSDGKALENVSGRGSIIEVPDTTDANAFFVNFEEATENFTDENGRIDWYFPRGSTVHIEVRAANYSVIKKVPEAETARIKDMENA